MFWGSVTESILNVMAFTFINGYVQEKQSIFLIGTPEKSIVLNM